MLPVREMTNLHTCQLFAHRLNYIHHIQQLCLAVAYQTHSRRLQGHAELLRHNHEQLSTLNL
jgi:hypothetical protein